MRVASRDSQNGLDEIVSGHAAMLPGTSPPSQRQHLWATLQMSLDIPLLNVCLKQEGTPCKSGVLLVLGCKHPDCRECMQLKGGHHGENAPSHRGYQCGISLSVVMAIALMTSHNSTGVIVNIY